MIEPISLNPQIPDFVKFIGPDKGLIADMMDSLDPSLASPINPHKYKGKVTALAYRQDGLTGLLTAVVRVE